jgi:DNA-binding NarL/FixJ family response regulator
MPNKLPDNTPDKITVLLVDDHNLVRRGFRRILEDESDMLVVAEASNGDDAVSLARKLRPKVIVMDCALPGTSGLAAARTILQEFPAQLIVMLSMHAEDTLVRQALDAGAHGYILKNAEDVGLGSAIRRVAAGEIVLSPGVSKSPSLKGERDSKLTARELEVLQLIADGHSNKAIADQLSLSVNTIAVHRANIMDALGIHKTAELIVYAIRNGLVNIS